MILHPGLLGHYTTTNQQLLERAATDHAAMLDRWKDEEDAADAEVGEPSARGRYINHMIQRGS